MKCRIKLISILLFVLSNTITNFGQTISVAHRNSTSTLRYAFETLGEWGDNFSVSVYGFSTSEYCNGSSTITVRIINVNNSNLCYRASMKLPSWVFGYTSFTLRDDIEDLFQNMVTCSGGAIATSYVPPSGEYEVEFQLWGNGSGEFCLGVSDIGTISRTVPERNISLELSLNSITVNNLVDLQNNLIGDLYSNARFNAYYLAAVSFSGPGGTVCTPAVYAHQWTYDAENTHQIISGVEWDWLFDNLNISCSGVTDPYTELPPGDYQLCMNMLSYYGNPIDPDAYACIDFTVAEPEYTIINSSSSINICNLGDIASQLIGSVQVSSNRSLEGFTLGAKITGPGGYLCQNVVNYPIDNATIPPLGQQALQSIIGTDAMSCSGGNQQNPFSFCLPNGDYTMTLMLFEPNSLTPISNYTSQSSPSCEIIVDNQEPEFEINTTINNSEPFNLNELITPGNIITDFNINIPVSNLELSAVITGNNGITIRSAGNVDIEQTTALSRPNLTSTEINDLLGEGQVIISGTTLTETELYNGLMPPGTYQLCFILKDISGNTITTTGEPCYAFTVNAVEPEFTIQTYITGDENVCSLTELYQHNLVVEIQSNIPFTDFNLSAIITGTGLSCGNLIQLPYSLTGSANQPVFVTSANDFDELLGEGSTNCPPDIYGNCILEGNYTLCFRLKDKNNNDINWATGSQPCIDFNINKSSQDDLPPPVIISPEFGERIDPVSGFQNIIFSWEPVPFAPPGIEYTLKIVEMPDTTSIPAKAMRSSTTPSFFEENLGRQATTYHYKLSDPELIDGNYYAFQVIASDPDNAVIFENYGASEVSYFKYCSNYEDEFNEPIVIKSEPVDAPEKVFYNRKISGNYFYNYRNIEGYANFDDNYLHPLANTNVQLKVAYVKFPDAKSVSAAKSAGNKWIDISDQFNDGGRILDNVPTNGEGYFEFYATIVSEDGVPDFGYHENLVNSSGNTLSGIVLKCAIVTHENPYFLFERNAVILDKDLSGLKLYADAKIYMAYFDFICSGKVFNNTSYNKLQGLIAPGTPIDHYDVYLLRSYFPEGIPYNSQGELKNGKNIIAKGSTTAKGKVYFRDLLLSQSPNDSYYIVVEPKPTDNTNFKFVPRYFKFDGNPSGVISDDIQQLTENFSAVYNDEYEMGNVHYVYTMDIGLPEIYGIVQTEQSSAGQGVAGVNINTTLLSDNVLNTNLNPPVGQTNLSPAFLYSNTGQRILTDFPDGSYSVSILPGINSNNNLKDFNVAIVASKSGYNSLERSFSFVSDLKINERKRVDLMIYPVGKIKGRVVLDDGTGVPGMVGIESQFLVAANYDGTFNLNVPTGKSTLQANPPQNLSASYFTEYKEINVNQGGTTTDVGDIVLRKRQHSINIKIVKYGTNPQEVIAGAKVKVKFRDGADFTTDNKGEVHYKFSAPSVTDLQIYAEGPVNRDFEPALWINDGTVTDIESKDEITITIPLKKAGRISGKVTYGEGDYLNPVDSARISVDLGNGLSIKTFTNAKGEYTLHNVPMNRNLMAIAAKGNSQYVGAKRYIYVNYSQLNNIDFNLTVYNGMDITHILHLPVEVHGLSLTGTGAKIEGAFYDFSLLTPTDWKIDNIDKLMVRFNTEIIPSSTEKNSDGIPLAIPKTGKIPTNLTSLEWKYKNKIWFNQLPAQDVFTIDNDGNGWAQVKGKMQLVMMQYNLNSAQIGLRDKKICIGNGGGQTPENRIMYTSIGKNPTSLFNLMDYNGENLEYQLFGFRSTAEKKTSVVKEDRTLSLDTRLHTLLQHVPERQQDLNIKLGIIEVEESAIKPINVKSPFEFALGGWNLMIPEWKLNEGGISTDSCQLKMQTKTVTINNFNISYTTLGTGLPEIKLGDIIISQSVPVEVKGTSWFAFDESSKMWCIDVRPGNTSASQNSLPCAAVVKELSIFDKGDELRAGKFALYTNNSIDATLSSGQYFGVYGISVFSPSDISMGFEKFELQGGLSVKIPGMGSLPNNLKLTKGTTRRKYKNTDIYDVVAKIDPVTCKINANSIEMELVSSGQKFAPGIFETATRIKPVGVQNAFTAKITKNTKSVEAVLDAGQSFAYSEGKILDQLNGLLKGFDNPIQYLNLSPEKIMELDNLSHQVYSLKTSLNNIDVPAEYADLLFTTASSDINEFSSMLNDLDDEDIISGPYKDQLMEYAGGMEKLQNEIKGFNLEDEAEGYLISHADRMGSMAENTWNDMDLAGSMKGLKGASGSMKFVVNSEWVANEQEIGVENVPSNFGGIGLTYNIPKKRMEGHVSFEKDFGSAAVEADASIVIGASGWYFVATGQFTLDAMNIEGAAGIMFGDHVIEPEIDEMFKEVSFYYRKLGEMPPNYPTRLSGFYFEAGAAIPIPAPAYISADFAVAKVEFVIRAGGDARMGVTFGNDVTTYSIGQGVFLEAWLEASAGFIACVEIHLEACVGMDISGEYSTNGDWWAEGVGYVTIAGSIEVGGGGCIGGCDGKLCATHKESGSITASVKAHMGSDYKKLSVSLKK
ncbi:MAG: carboxypeptidase regulatory-like domain-containing protein [Bacteroidales bacterium]|nr:carboxypeptidase regulatory-like domain-containing protein [Bacteroidales bacterium]